MATPQQIAVTQLYTALFNRAPDAAGLAFWEQAMLNGASINTIAESFFTSPEALAIYPSAAPTTQFVTRFYTTVFGREPDAEGLVFWSNALDAQGGAGNAAARAALVTQLVDIVSTPLTSKPAGISDAAYAQTVADRGRFINKTDVGVYFATELKSDDRALAAKVLAAVTHEPASVTEARGVVVGTPPTPTVPTTPTTPGGGGGVVVTPPATPPSFSNADSASAIRDRLSAYTGSAATVDATGMSEAKLLEVARYASKVAADGITKLSVTLAGTSIPLPALDLLLGQSQGAKIDVTGGKFLMPTIANQISHIADGGITGTIELAASLGAPSITLLLGPKLASSAQVRVDANLMNRDQLTPLVDNIGKIIAIDNLTVRWGEYGNVTDAMSKELLTKATNPTFDMAGATDAHVHMIAAYIMDGKPMEMRGSIDLSKGGFTLDETKALLSKTSSPTSVSADGWDAAQLASLSVYADKVNVITGASIVLGDALMTDALSTWLLSKMHLGNVNLTDASAAEFSAVLERMRWAGFKMDGEIAINRSLDDNMFQFLNRYVGTSLTVDMTGMTREQVGHVMYDIGKLLRMELPATWIFRLAFTRRLSPPRWRRYPSMPM